MTLHGTRRATMRYLSQFPSSAGGLGLRARISSMAKWIDDYMETMADYYAAATLYEELSRLSDAELHRRGLSRARLARDICDACVHARDQIPSTTLPLANLENRNDAQTN